MSGCIVSNQAIYKGFFIDLDDAEHLISNQRKHEKVDFECPSCHQPVEAVLNVTRKRKHFRHSNGNTHGMSEWHREWQSHFGTKETSFVDENGVTHRADAMVSGGDTTLFIEFQHSSISQQEIRQRQEFYGSIGTLVWVVDLFGHSTVFSASDDEWIVDLTQAPAWIRHIKTFFADSGDGWIYPVDLCNDTYRTKRMTKLDLIAQLLRGDPSFQRVQQSYLRLIQRGAGNGKTFELVQSIDLVEKHLYKTYHLFLTKTHSAKEMLQKELSDQEASGRLSHVEELEQEETSSGRQQVFSCRTVDGHQKLLIFGTIDAFNFALLPPSEKKSLDFPQKAKWLSQQEQLGPTIVFGGHSIILNQTLVLHVDECQDLHPEYAGAMLNLCRRCHIDIDVVGDRLQSLWMEHNMMTALADSTDPVVSIMPRSNVCRRFVHPVMRDQINAVVPFQMFGCDPITLHEEIDYGGLPPIQAMTFAGDKEKDMFPSLIMQLKCAIKQIFDECCDLDATSLHRRPMPEDFLFICPIPGAKSYMGRLEEFLNDFWTDLRDTDDYYAKVLADRSNQPFAQLHTSDEASRIDLETSRKKSRLVSIHTAKGDGRRFVFVMELSEHLLYCFTHGPLQRLQFESFIHVAITRQKRNLFLLFHDSSRQDEIGRRFPLSLHEQQNKCPFFRFEYWITPKKLQMFLSLHEDMPMFDALVDDRGYMECAERLSRLSAPEWKHYKMQYALMHFYWGVNMSKHVIDSQFTQTHRYHVSRKVEILRYSEFTKVLFEISRLNEELSRLEKKDERYWLVLTQKNRLPIPLLQYQSRPDLPEQIKNRIETMVLPQLLAPADKFGLGPLDCLLAFYVVDVFDEGILYGKDEFPTVYSMYEIFESIPNQDFIESVSIFQSSCRHYLETQSLSQKLRCYKKKFKSASSDQFRVEVSKPHILIGKDEVHIHHLIPDYNEVNRIDKKLAMLVNQFAIQEVCREEDLQRADGSTKRVKTFLFTLTHSRCFEVNISTDIIHTNDVLIRSYLESIRETHKQTLWGVVSFCQQQSFPSDFQILEYMYPGDSRSVMKKRNQFGKSMIGKWISDWEDIRDLSEEQFMETFNRKWSKGVEIAVKDMRK